MTGVFLTVLNMSLTASFAALAVLLLRLPLRRVPKIFSYSLWSVVLFRLLCPVSLRSMLSFFPRAAATAPAVQTAVPAAQGDAVQSAVSPLGGMTFVNPASDTVTAAANASAFAVPADIRSLVLQIASWVWLLGIYALLLYGVFSCLKLRHRLFGATRVSGNVLETDGIPTAFVFGFLRPKIYLPVGLSKEEANYILAHERTHIRRRDHLIKPLAFLALCLHWFNPLIWFCYFQMLRDMEMSCDESVLRHSAADIRKPYASSLLSFSARRSGLNMALMFGESHTKSRVKHVLIYQKPAFWAVIAAVVVVAAAGAGLALNPNLPGYKLLASTGGTTSSSAAGSRTAASESYADGETSSVTSAPASTAPRLVGQNSQSAESSAVSSASELVYNNTKYKFTFRLPADWKGFSVIEDKWTSSQGYTGTLLRLRSSKWTKKNPYSDIQIVVFTYAQWALVMREKLSMNAGQPFYGPAELGRNQNYVFTQMPRWEFYNYPGMRELETLYRTQPLQGYNETPLEMPALVYRNAQYGFTLNLPTDWKGYTVSTGTWTAKVTGYNGKTTMETGAVVRIHNSNWSGTGADMNVAVFSYPQWEEVANGSLVLNSDSTGLIDAQMGCNDRYVFSPVPGWQSGSGKYTQELRTLIKSQPLHPFDLS